MLDRQKPRETLLAYIMNSQGVYQHKYTGAFNALRAVMRIEKDERHKDRLPQHIFDEYEALVASKDSLSKEFDGVPLIVLEQYFFRKGKDLNKEIYLSYADKEIVGIKAIHYYYVLEEFFNKIYDLAVKIADYYTIEVKLKRPGQDQGEDVF